MLIFTPIGPVDFESIRVRQIDINSVFICTVNRGHIDLWIEIDHAFFVLEKSYFNRFLAIIDFFQIPTALKHALSNSDQFRPEDQFDLGLRYRFSFLSYILSFWKP